MKRNQTLDIPLIKANRESESPLLGLNDEGFSSGSEISPTLNQYSAFLTSSSDYSKFPANVALAKDRARKHKLRDRKKYIDRGRLPLWKSKEVLMKYSMTSYFYFDFLEQGINILFITFLFCGIFDLIAVLAFPSYTEPGDTQPSFVFSLSTFSIHYFPSLLTIKVTLAMVNLILVKVYSLVKEKSRIRKYLNLKNISQNYFSILIQGLPKDLDLKLFYEFLAVHLNGRSEDKIKKVILLQENAEKQRLLKLRKECYVKSLHSKSEEEREICEFEVEKVDQDIAAEDRRLAAHERFNGSIIIIMNDTYSAIRILKKWNKLTVPKRILATILQKLGYRYLEEYEFQGRFINIEKAGEPFDIEWKNSGKSEVNIFLRGVFASIVLWGVVLTYPILNISVSNNNKPEEEKSDLINNVWAYTPYILIIITINLTVVLLINFLSIFSGLRRKSDVEKRKIAMKVAFNFISFGLLISAKAFLDSIETQSKTKESTKESLVNTISLLMFYLIFLPQIIELLDVEFIYKYLRRKYYLRKNDFSSLSQGELDEILKQPYFDYSTRVGNVAQTVFLGLASAPIFPLAPLLAIAALYAALLVDRYLILRRCSDWKIVGTNLGISFPKAYSYNLFVQVIGILLFLVLIEPKSGMSQTQYVLIFVMGLGYIYCFAKYLSPVMMKHAYSDLKVSNMSYENEERRFKTSYEELYQDFLMNGK